MSEAKQVYEIITDIWHLWKKYGDHQLTADQWDAFINDGQRMHKKHEAVSDQIDSFFRDMFMALQNYYERKEQA